MESNWYVICTQKKQEKRASALLSKKGFETFCPFTITEEKVVSRITRQYAPLFANYVFVKATENDLRTIRKTACVVNTLFWGSKPAVVTAEEINAIKSLVTNYSRVSKSTIAVNPSQKISIVEKNLTSFSTNLVSIKHQGVSVTLPSIGFSLSTERENSKSTIIAEKKPSAGASFVKKLNPMVLFGF